MTDTGSVLHPKRDSQEEVAMSSGRAHRLIFSLAALFVAIVAGWQWALGGQIPGRWHDGSEPLLLPGPTDVAVTLNNFPFPDLVVTETETSAGAETTVVNHGPTVDEVVVIETLDIPAGCEGRIGSSHPAGGGDTAVVFGTVPAMGINEPTARSSPVAVLCHQSGVHDLIYRIEAQPVFGDDDTQDNNLVVVPRSICAVPDLASDFDLDGLPTPDEQMIGTNPCLGDTDQDGCADGRELGDNHATGGQRNPLDGFDFFDVPIPYSPVPTQVGKDRAITAADILTVRQGAGHVAGDGFYNAQYDRTPSTNPAQPWRAGPPDGAISAQDILVVRASAGDSCR